MNTSQGKKKSQKYNRYLQQRTLHAAILPFLENPNMHPELQQAISKHYDLKQSLLQQQLTQWATENPLCMPHYNNCLAIWSKQQALKLQSRHRGHNHSSTTKQPPQTDRITAREVNGVIEIDLDDEDYVAFQTAIQASLGEESPSSQQKKPAAAAVASCSDTNHESTRSAPSCGNNTIITHAASCLSTSVNSEIDLCAAEELEDNQNIQEAIAVTNVSRPTTVLKETNHNVAAYSLSCNTMEQENRTSGAIVLDVTEDD